MVSKLFPFWWLLSPVVVCASVKACLEGDYSDYSIYDTFKDTDSYTAHKGQDAVINIAETMILIFDAENLVAKSYTIATKVLSASIVSDVSWLDGDGGNIGLNRKSVLGTYVVAEGFSTTLGNNDKVYVFKDGVLLKTLEDSDLGIADNTIRAVAISPTGKHIIVSGYITAESAMGWVVLVGS